MNSSRQLLLGTGVFLGGGMLLFAMVKQIDAPQNETAQDQPKAAEVSSNTEQSNPLTADLETEERILAEKRRQRELKNAQLDKQTREFLAEQERAEALAMEKARLENERYRENAIEPVVDEQIPEAAVEPQKQEVAVTKPVVTARPTESTQQKTANTRSDSATATSSQNTQNSTQATNNSSQRAPSRAQEYTVQHGDGLIKLSRRYNVPVAALAEANNMSTNTALRLGQKITIPSASQVNQLVSRANSSNSRSTASENNTRNSSSSNPAPTSSAPTRQLDYKVTKGDGLIKLARQYNVPVEALAEANNLSTNSSLHVGQSLTIPSRLQVARLQREAEQKRLAASREREAQQRLADARRKAQSGEAKGQFGVQVALADSQEKADEIVKQMRAAGYPASTSRTSKGVRVIVGPEKGKEAALALKDKINADSSTGVNNAWVLYWR